MPNLCSRAQSARVPFDATHAHAPEECERADRAVGKDRVRLTRDREHVRAQCRDVRDARRGAQESKLFGVKDEERGVERVHIGGHRARVRLACARPPGTNSVHQAVVARFGAGVPSAETRLAQ
jgi:hypothetical protein